MPLTIVDTWSEAWVDLDDYALLNPEPFAQLWRCLNTKRGTMQKTAYIPFVEGGIFTLAALAFPDGTNPAHLKANQTRANGAVDLQKVISRIREYLLIPVVIDSVPYQWATGTPASYTVIADVDAALFGLLPFQMAEWRECVESLRTFLDKLDLLVEIPSVGIELTTTTNERTWRVPYAKTNIVEPALKIVANYFTFGQSPLFIPNVVPLAFTSATGSYDEPQKFIDNRPTPPTLSNPITCYATSVQKTSSRSRFDTGPGLTSFYPVEWYSYSTDLAWQISGAYFEGVYHNIVVRGSETSYEGDVTIFESPTQSIQITETSILPVNLIEKSRYTGNYSTDGGSITANKTTVHTFSPGYTNTVTVCAVRRRIPDDVVITYTFSRTGYLAGNMTSYSIDAGCPVSVSVSLGAYDIINNRTPVTITTDAFTTEPFTASVSKAVPERTLTINVKKFESPVNMFVAYSSLGAQIYKYIFSSTSTSTHVITSPAYSYYEWTPYVDQTWSVNFT